MGEWVLIACEFGEFQSFGIACLLFVYLFQRHLLGQMLPLWLYHRYRVVWLLQGRFSLASWLSLDRSFHSLYRDLDHLELLLLFALYPLSLLQNLIPFLLKSALYQFDQLFVSHLEHLDPSQQLDIFRFVFVEVLFIPFPLPDNAFPQGGHASA